MSEFKWSPELVDEFYGWLDGRSGTQVTISLMDEFKRSKESDSVLFETTDGVKISSGMVYYYIHNWDVHKCTFSERYAIPKADTPTFSTKEAAARFVLDTKPVLCLNDLICVSIVGDPFSWLRKLEEIAKSKIENTCT